MNKTIDINLANMLFHIDERAYIKLQHYLEAIKRSFSGTPGSDEIIADIEARIAELFHEKIESDRQVITVVEVEDVIKVMGQPEDYLVDEDIFEDPPRQSAPTKRSKKLYRDIDSKYIAGVSSGMGHYLGIDALWVRLLWVFLTIFSGGGFIFIYILLWVLIPEAVTTSQKLDMTGEKVNISNIERKVKEGFDDVADRIQNVDYSKVKSSGRTFFDAIGDVIMFLFKVFGKFIGILMIIVGASTLIGLFIGLFTVGILDVVHLPGIDFYDVVNSTGAAVWLVSLLMFFAIGIPFFFIMYLGLKILVRNLKSIGNIAKFALLGLWLLSIIGLTVLGVRQATAHAFTGSSTETKELYFDNASDTLRIKLVASQDFDDQDNIGINNMKVIFDDNNNRYLFADDVRFDVAKSEDSLTHIKIRKDADGNSFSNARDRASKIEYEYVVEGNMLLLNNYLTTDLENKIRDQEVHVTVYVPVGKEVQFDTSTKRRIGRGTRYDQELYRSELVDYRWRMEEHGELHCLNCPENLEHGDPSRDEDGHIIIDEEGIDIDIQDNEDSFKMKIDADGVQIKTQESKN